MPKGRNDHRFNISCWIPQRHISNTLFFELLRDMLIVNDEKWRIKMDITQYHVYCLFCLWWNWKIWVKTITVRKSHLNTQIVKFFLPRSGPHQTRSSSPCGMMTLVWSNGRVALPFERQGTALSDPYLHQAEATLPVALYQVWAWSDVACLWLRSD